MANTTGVFDYQMSFGGISIIPARSYVTNAAMSEAELDAQVAAAKADLDAVAARAKAALRKRPNILDGLRVADA